MKQTRDLGPVRSRQLCAELRHLEGVVVRIRKLLRAVQGSSTDRATSRSVDELVKICRLVETTSRLAQDCDELEASETLDVVELATRELNERVLGFLTSTLGV